MAEIGEDRIYLSVAAAVHDFEQRTADPGAADTLRADAG